MRFNCIDGQLNAIPKIVELTLLLNSKEAAQLEGAAFQRGQTIGQTLRDLVRDFLHAARSGDRRQHSS